MSATQVPLELISGDGSAATKNTGVASGNVPLMDGTGYPAADGSQITGVAAAGVMNLEATKTLSGTNTAEWLSLTAGSTLMEISGFDVSHGTSSSEYAIILGNSGGYVTSGYKGRVTEDKDSRNMQYTALSAQFDLQTNGQGISYEHVFAYRLRRVNGHVWTLEGQLITFTGANEHHCWTLGSVDLTTELDRIKLVTHNATNNWDAGFVSLWTNKS